MTNSLHHNLRQGCLAAHEAIECSYPFNRLVRNDITKSEMTNILSTLYQVHTNLSEFLYANLKAHYFYEFIDHACRIKELRKDIDCLATNPTSSFLPINLPNSTASSIGVLYVLMGSTLGGALIAKSLAKCTDENVKLAIHFFGGGAENRGIYWANFIEALRTFTFDIDEERLAIEGAVYTFSFIQEQFIKERLL